MVTEEKLTGRDLEMQIAERVMGWQRGGTTPSGNVWYEANGESYLIGETRFTSVWTPSTKLEAAAQVEDRINDLGLWHEYASALLELTGTQYQSSLPVIVWAIVRATPEERCVAALEAIESK